MYHLTDNPQYRTRNLKIRILVNCNEQNFDKWIRLVSKSKHRCSLETRNGVNRGDPLRFRCSTKDRGSVWRRFLILYLRRYRFLLNTPQINLWYTKLSSEFELERSFPTAIYTHDLISWSELLANNDFRICQPSLMWNTSGAIKEIQSQHLWQAI